MKKIPIALALWTAAVLAGFALPSHAENAGSASAQSQGNLTIEVHAAANDDGYIDISLLSNAEQFNGKAAPQQNCRETIKQQRARCTFVELQHGDYALFVYHDENDNHKLDENFLGAPTEKLAISAVDLVSNSSPTFEQSTIRFQSSDGQVFINLQ